MKKPSKKQFITIIVIVSVAVVMITAFFIIKNLTSGSDSSDEVNIAIDFDDDITRIDWSKYPTYEIELSSNLDISNPGVYKLTGEIADGRIAINTDDNVKLELAAVKITNSDGPAIFVQNAKNVVISAVAETTNYLTDGASYDGYADDEIGTIFSHDDLMLEGDGTFVIKSNYEDAIVSKDDLLFNGGTYQITSADDSIRGKDSVYIQSGSFLIKSSGDGIKATNDTEPDKGFVYIIDGQFNIEAELDAIQAESTLKISGGDFEIKTGGGSGNVSTNETWGNWGRGPGMYANVTTTDTSDSAKGIKASDILIENGTFSLNSSDDALHANGNLKIQDGNFTIASGDDGIHADSNLVIDDGRINVTQSYEGIEGTTVTINGGDISVVASDDGLNAAGGNDASSMNRPGANQFAADETAYIRIRGGNVEIFSSGDSIDSNGHIYLDGGNVSINGPTNGSDNALDHDGELIYTGGTLLASEIAGMMDGGISESSTIYNVTVNLQSTYNAGTLITIEDTNGAELAHFEPQKTFSSITVGSPDLRADTTYTIKINGTVYQSFTTSSISTQIGTSGMGGGMHGGAPQGGKSGMQR